MKRLEHKVCIITGAASGIGRGAALLFAEHGARLIAVDQDEAGLASLAAELGAGCELLCHTGDIADAALPAALVASTLERFGRIDVLFNNAGIMPTGDMLGFERALWERVQAVNVTAMFALCQAALPTMLAQGAGAIVNTSSVMATLTEPGYEAYTTSKAAVIGLTKAIAVSYATRGIRCNCVCPGWVDTPMNRKLADDLGGLEQLTPLILRQQPLGRMASVREVAHAVLFLASDEASAVTGSALYVDGAASAAI